MLIRAGVPGDLERMYVLDCVCFEAPFRFTRGAMRRYISAAGAFSFVAEQDGFAGFVVVQVESGRAGLEGYCVTLDVGLGWRRLGVARTLMEAAEARAAELGALWLTLHVWTGNLGAVSLYEALGFERVMLDQNFYGEGMDAFGYRKHLLPQDRS